MNLTFTFGKYKIYHLLLQQSITRLITQCMEVHSYVCPALPLCSFMFFPSAGSYDCENTPICEVLHFPCFYVLYCPQL